MANESQNGENDGFITLATEFVSAVKGLESVYSDLERTVRADLDRQNEAFKERASTNGAAISALSDYQQNRLEPVLTNIERHLKSISEAEQERTKLAKEAAAEEKARRKDLRETIAKAFSSTPAQYLFMAIAVVIATYIANHLGVSAPEYPVSGNSTVVVPTTVIEGSAREAEETESPYGG